MLNSYNRAKTKGANMATVKEGDTIRIHYTGKLEDGTVFDSSEGATPLEFTVGGGAIISGLEQGVIGMTPGESKTITIPMEQAYGPHQRERVFEFDRKKAPENFNPEVGQRLQMYRADGMPITATVVGISEASVTMDCNHPLAGKTLVFDTTLVEIV
jgi:FKBP-type peptidyl-prolyl cis-trans isomerase 2